MRLEDAVYSILSLAPWLHKLPNDGEWVEIADVLEAVRHSGRWKKVSYQDLELISSRKIEVRGEKMQALDVQRNNLAIEKKEPPEVLYYTTIFDDVRRVLDEGVTSGGNRFTHLVTDPDLAEMLEFRKCVVLKVMAREAWKDGVEFYKANECVWLVSELAPQYIKINWRD